MPSCLRLTLCDRTDHKILMSYADQAPAHLQAPSLAQLRLHCRPRLRQTEEAVRTAGQQHQAQPRALRRRPPLASKHAEDIHGHHRCDASALVSPVTSNMCNMLAQEACIWSQHEIKDETTGTQGSPTMGRQVGANRRAVPGPGSGCRREGRRLG